MTRSGRPGYLALMPAVQPAAPTSRYERTCLLAALVLPLCWFVVYDHFAAGLLCDEPGHIGNIYSFIEQQPGWPAQMTMLPGYHFLVVSLWRLHLPLDVPSLARLVTAITATIGIAAFAIAARTLHSPDRPLATAGPPALLFALLPILQPFTGMAYTDAPSLAFALTAVALHYRRRHATAALAFIPGLLMRQTNLVWPAFLVALEFFRNWRDCPAFFARTRWLLALLAGSALTIVAALRFAGRLTLGTQTGQDVDFNPATLHTLGLFVLLLGLPLLVAGTPAALRSLFSSLRAHPFRTAGLIAGGLAAAGIATATYRNPHVWNRDLFWDGCTFTLLRNWPLVWIDGHPWLRLASGANLMLMSVALVRLVAGQPHRLALVFTLGFGLVPAFINNLVEPRYFIPAAAFFLLHLNLTPVAVRLLASWWLLLCAVHAPFIVRGLSLW